MPILSSEIEFRLSGGASNTDPNASLGGAMSTVGGGLITTAVLNNLWDDVSGDESAAGDTEYRCIYVRNANASLTLSSAVLWIQSVSTSPDTTFALALAGEGKGGTAETVANESTAPTGETFTSPTSKGAGLSLGNLANGEFYPVWIRRVVGSGASAFNNDSVTLRVEGDTPA